MSFQTFSSINYAVCMRALFFDSQHKVYLLAMLTTLILTAFLDNVFQDYKVTQVVAE